MSHISSTTKLNQQTSDNLDLGHTKNTVKSKLTDIVILLISNFFIANFAAYK